MSRQQAASLQQVARRSVEPSDPHGESHAHLSGRMLPLARVLWVAVTVLALVVFAAGIPTRFDTLSSGAIGIGLRQNGAGEFVISPTPGLPAAESGVQEGDILIGVNGVSLQPGMEMPSLLRLLRGAPGTQIRLDVRSLEGSTRQYNITRLGYPLEEYRISTDVYALYLTTLGVTLVLGFGIPALIIFLRKSEDRLALLVSLTILIFGISNSAAYAGSSFLPSPLSEAMSIAYNLSVLLILYVFPDGRFVPRWTRRFVLVGGAWILWKILPIPFGEILRTSHLWIVIDVVIFGTGIFAQIYRYRYVSGPQERQQTKWITYGMAVAFLAQYAYYLPLNLVPAVSARTALGLGFSLVGTTFHHLALLVLPITVSHAVLRRRLYEIDVIINRTLVYVPVSAIVVGTFTAAITLSQRLFVAVTGETSDAAIVLTTLLVAATVAPIKERVQVLVDKRFKEPPDPVRRLKAFGEQVRLRITPIDARQVMRRLLDVTVTAFDAKGGVTYLEQDGQLQLIHMAGEWNGEAQLDVPLMNDSRRLGMLSLGARGNGRDYASQDRKALEQVVGVVAQAIEKDSKGR
jgi:hypothetical protein